MPEHGLPVRAGWPFVSRAVRRHDMAKADAEKTGIVRHAEGAHGKIFLFRKISTMVGGRAPAVFLESVFGRVAAGRARDRRKSPPRAGYAEDEILIGHRLIIWPRVSRSPTRL